MNMSLKSKLFFSKNLQGLLSYFWNERNNHIIAEWPIKQSATNCIRFAALFKQSGQSHCVCYHLKAEWLITLCLLPSPSRVANRIVFSAMTKQSSQFRRVTRGGGGFPCPFLKFKEKCPNFGKKMS